MSVTPLFACKVVFVIARTIRVNTEDLWNASKRYERLASDIEAMTDGLKTVRADLTGGCSRDDYLLRTDAINRKINGIAYRLRELGGKLVFAASRYEEYDRRLKQDAETDDGDDLD